ncbi:MAG: VWA domain-containing protein, partial [Flavobacteriaceae bacterium]
MQTQTLLLIIAAAIASLGIVVFQYYYKSKKRGSTTIVLSILRFIGLLSILLLLINPKFLKQDFVLEKTDLLVLLDNSSSVAG